MRRIFWLFLLVSPTLAGAQSTETLFGEGGLRVTGFRLGPQAALGVFEAESLPMGGGVYALELNREVLIGWAHLRSKEAVGLPPAQPFTYRQNGLFLGYAFRPHRLVHPVFSLLMGGGKVTYSDDTTDRLFSLVPSLGFELNVFRWFRIQLSAGYRLVDGSAEPDLPDEALSGFQGQALFLFGWSNE
ncbi:MAG: hypothetical protein D6765_17650 [Bacteroidetes bacterium]|nr:MAG: hypothetical protein D6765_17650 [Bacteroidota bacterium]